MDAERERDNRASGKDDSGWADSGQGAGQKQRADSGARGQVYGRAVGVAVIH